MLLLWSFFWVWWRTGFPLIPQSNFLISSWISSCPLTCITQVSAARGGTKIGCITRLYRSSYVVPHCELLVTEVVPVSYSSFPDRRIFCFNPVPSSNVIMQELRKKNVKILSEKVLLLLNRGGKNATSPLAVVLVCVCVCSDSDSEPSLSRRPRVHVQSHAAGAARGPQVFAGCLCQQRDCRHLLPHWHDGHDWHCRSADIWPFTWRQGELHSLDLHGCGSLPTLSGWAHLI